MKLMIVCGSNREAAQSTRIGRLIAGRIAEGRWPVDTDLIALAETDLPRWEESKWADEEPWPTIWGPVSDRLAAAAGFIFVVPEWGGMVPPQVKNLFLLCSKGELAHKPGLIVAVSSGTGGAYPVAELRSSSYKNTFINWIPEHVIIRHVKEFEPGSGNDATPDWLVDRLDYSISLLAAYAEALQPVRQNVMDLKRFKTGM